MKRTAVMCAPLLLALNAQSQTITEATVTTISLSIDSEGTDNGPDWIMSGDPSISPFVFDMSSEVEEPIRPPFGQPSFHRSSNVGQIESIGSVWSGFADSSVEYAETLDLGVDVGDPSIVSGSVTTVFHRVMFTLDQPTRVELQAMFRTDLNQPYNISILDGLFISIVQNDTELLATDFDSAASGVDQAFDGDAELAAGDYEFRVHSNLAALESIGYRSATANFDYSLTFVPAPASATLFAAAGMLARRRRY